MFGEWTMSRLRRLFGLAMLVAVATCGCETSREQIRPPKPVEEYNAPPDDPRYAGPVQYPAEAMELDPTQKRSRDGAKGPGGPIGRPGAGPMTGPGRMPGQ